MRRVVALVALAACGKGGDARPVAVAAASVPLDARPADASAPYDVPLADGALVTRAEQTAILHALQGTWRLPWIQSDSPRGAKDTVWHVAGDGVTIVDGSRTRHATLRVLAPCLLQLDGLDGIDGPHLSFLVEPDGVRLYANAIGRRIDGGWIACDVNDVITIRGDACTVTSFQWRTGTIERAPVRCALGRRYDHEAWIFGDQAAGTEQILFVVGDELHDTLVPLSPPMKSE